MPSAAAVSRDPARLAALCQLWVAEKREVWLTLRGYSMGPAIEHRSRVLLRCAPCDLKPGQVAAYLRDGKLVIHRALRCEDQRWIFRGDGNAFEDEPVPAEAMIGVVSAIRSPSAAVRLACGFKRLAFTRFRRRSARAGG